MDLSRHRYQRSIPRRPAVPDAMLGWNNCWPGLNFRSFRFLSLQPAPPTRNQMHHVPACRLRAPVGFGRSDAASSQQEVVAEVLTSSN